MTIHKKLMQARMALQHTNLTKSGQNTFAGYKYFELGDFLPAINSIFNELGLCGVVSFTKELATLTITDVDDGKEIVITSPMAEANLKGCHPIQNLGAVETYQRRYLWMSAFEIVEHDALDASEPLKEVVKELKTSPAPLLQPPPISQGELDACVKSIVGCTDMDTLKGIFGGAYKRANTQQKTILNDIYHAQKSLLEKAA